MQLNSIKFNQITIKSQKNLPGGGRAAALAPQPPPPASYEGLRPSNSPWVWIGPPQPNFCTDVDRPIALAQTEGTLNAKAHMLRHGLHRGSLHTQVLTLSIILQIFREDGHSLSYR